jgi:thioredoxin domain protein
MRKVLLLLVCVMVACVSADAQGVKFASGTWDKVLKQAKKKDKIIFVDVYTTWCGPCKQVATKVFPQEKVGEVYNSNFINYQIDAESPAGKEFTKKYPADAYPTFYFINGEGEVLHKMTGAGDANHFISEGKMIVMYARYGGKDNFMAAIKNGTADPDMLYEYYQSANKSNKPEAVNLCLKALPTEELISKNNKLIEEISQYDKELMFRFVDEIIKASNDGRLSDEKYYGDFLYYVVFPIQFDISLFLNQSIKTANWERLNELLELKAKFANYGGQMYPNGNVLDGDLDIGRGRGLFFATPEYVKLCYWAENREGEEEFKVAFPRFMERIMNEYPLDTLAKAENNSALDEIREKGLTEFLRSYARDILERGKYTTPRIVAWTDYFWKLSPSDQKTKELCSQWALYAYHANRFNGETAYYVADFLARIGDFEQAKAVLEKAIASQKEIRNDDKELMKDLELKLRDVNNRKL